MLKATFYIQRTNTGSEDDDVIRIYDAECPDMFRVVYTTPDLEKGTQFYMSRSVATQYIVDLIQSLKYDSEPFDYFQVSTAIHPSVMYHISDFDNPQICNLIEEMVYSTLKVETFPALGRSKTDAFLSH